MVLSSTSGNDAGLVEDSAAAVLLQACLGWGKMESMVYEETGGKQAEDFYCNSSGTSYGLSAEVKRLLRDTRGITALYEWQDRCLCSPALHLLYSLPTRCCREGRTCYFSFLLCPLCRRSLRS